ncbi:hypothetical protein [Legionella sp. km772]|uniref:hypothetical protein n=1 Tax=Legionella sp. km772 TaxID=2498111 RepID=UPI0013158A44|nr:hypothetical protein [Legionella sp. km772]
MMDFLENHVQTRERAIVEAALQQVNESLKRARASITEMNNPLTHSCYAHKLVV